MTLVGNWIHCWKCKTEYHLPPELDKAARASEKILFWCPYGHSAYFPTGQTDEDRLRRRAEIAEQRVAQKDDDITRLRESEQSAWRKVSAHKGQVTKLKKRASVGVCPCCNRTFKQLAAHMKNKHPQFARDAPAAATA